MTDRIENKVALTDEALELVVGGLQQGGEWTKSNRGNYVYSGWAKEGTKEMTYSGSIRREYTGDGHINFWSFDGKNEHLKGKINGSF